MSGKILICWRVWSLRARLDCLCVGKGTGQSNINLICLGMFEPWHKLGEKNLRIDTDSLHWSPNTSTVKAASTSSGIVKLKVENLWICSGVLLISAQVTDFLFVCPLSRKSFWQLRPKRKSLPIWVSSTSSLGREMRRPPLLPGWMVSCACITVHPICLPLFSSLVIHFETSFDFHTLFCCCCHYCFGLHACVWFIIVLIHYCLLASKHTPLPFMACLSLSVVITGRTQKQISQSMNRLRCLRGKRATERNTEGSRRGKGVTTERKGGWGRRQEAMRKAKGKGIFVEQNVVITLLLAGKRSVWSWARSPGNWEAGNELQIEEHSASPFRLHLRLGPPEII